MAITMSTGFGGHGAAASILRERFPAFGVLLRSVGGVRLVVDGADAPAPSGPPLAD